jgi:pilus assembly protein CpaC
MIRHMTKSYWDGIKAGLLVLLAMLWATQPAFAADEVRLELGSGALSENELDVAVGKSLIVYSPKRIKEIIIGNPAVTDVKLISSQQVLLLGKAAGRTNMALRDSKKNVIAILDVVVGYDVVGLKRKIHEALPQEKAIEVRGANDSVMLSGQVSSALAMDSVLAIARSFAPEDKVLNMLQVGGGQQVMLEARISEVNRSSLKDLGVRNTISGTEGQKDLSVLSLVTGGALANTAFGTFSLTETGVFSSLALQLDALEQQGLANTLAEPNIVALSGHEASFLAGGEFPVPVAQSSVASAGIAPGDITVQGGITVEFKEFGVGLKFTPTVLSSRKINLKLQTEVSAIDTATQASVGFGSIPGVRTRRASTTIEMADGQSFAIAGLLQNDINNAVNKFPGLGDIPVLGALFRSTDFQREETELVILVTPRLVKPIPSGRHVLPTDGFIPPNNQDQYLFGRLEGLPDAPATEQAAPSGSGSATEQKAPSGIEGAHGHQL